MVTSHRFACAVGKSAHPGKERTGEWQDDPCGEDVKEAHISLA